MSTAALHPDIRAQLLDIGGADVADTLEEDAAALLERAKVFPTGKITPMPGAPSQCHRNVAALTEANPDVQIATGWALSGDDGIWRQHTWGWHRRHGIVETTEARISYWGIVLTETEADDFRFNNF